MRAAVVCLVFTLVWAVGTLILADPTATVHTDSDTYQSGDAVLVGLSAENDHVAMSVDVYVGIIVPSGDIWSTQYDGWRNSIEAWVPSIYVPPWFTMEPTPFWTFNVPCDFPPIESNGDYSFAAVLTYPGTLGWVGNASLAPFSYSSGGPSPEITMVRIPTGAFMMGSPPEEPARWMNEGPQRSVNVSAFEMSETEVTQWQWEDVMGWNDSHFRGDSLPVESVTWFDCVSFCNKLSQEDGCAQCYTMTEIEYEDDHIASASVICDFEAYGYRLPTEAEWEYACRAGTTTCFYTGSGYFDLDRAGWYSGISDSTTHAVRQKEPNLWGLYDMHGNVWEWSWDWYSYGYYGTRPDPDSNPTGPDTGERRVARGGSYEDAPNGCRSAIRAPLAPDSMDTIFGFRVVRPVN